MKRWAWFVLAGLAAVTAAPSLAEACSLCGDSVAQAATFRQDLASARLVLYGAVVASRPDAAPGAANGTSDFRVKTVLKADPDFAGTAEVSIPRYVPVTDPKNPPLFLVFSDVIKGRLDIYRGVPATSETVGYVKGLLALKDKPTTDVLLHCADYLEHADKALAADAFLEFARAADREIGAVAPKLPPAKLRAWLKDPRTPPERLGMYAFLLGACGNDADAATLRALAENPGERFLSGLDGVLGGYAQLRPKGGWHLALSVLADRRRPFGERYAVLRMARFFRGWKPEQTRADVLRVAALALRHADMADLAVEDLRKGKEWALTAEVLALFDKPGYEGPLTRRALVRYALACPKPEAARFLDAARRADPETVRDVEELEKK